MRNNFRKPRVAYGREDQTTVLALPFVEARVETRVLLSRTSGLMFGPDYSPSKLGISLHNVARWDYKFAKAPNTFDVDDEKYIQGLTTLSVRVPSPITPLTAFSAPLLLWVF